MQQCEKNYTTGITEAISGDRYIGHREASQKRGGEKKREHVEIVTSMFN
jgi:hypothetical protein